MGQRLHTVLTVAVGWWWCSGGASAVVRGWAGLGLPWQLSFLLYFAFFFFLNTTDSRMRGCLLFS